MHLISYGWEGRTQSYILPEVPTEDFFFTTRRKRTADLKNLDLCKWCFILNSNEFNFVIKHQMHIKSYRGLAYLARVVGDCRIMREK